YLLNPPTGTSPCSYWTGTGGSSISIDGSSNGCSISVVRSSSDGRIFTVTSMGSVYDGMGTLRAKRTVTADLVMPPPNIWCTQKAFLATVTQAFPAYLSFLGDVHVNGNITSLAWSQSIVGATGSVQWGSSTTYGPPSSVLTSQPARFVPPINVNDYSSYAVDG